MGDPVPEGHVEALVSLVHTQRLLGVEIWGWASVLVLERNWYEQQIHMEPKWGIVVAPQFDTVP